MCISLNENCFGAMYALDKTLLWNIEYVTSRFKLEYLFIHLIIIILCFTPIMFYSYFDNFKICIGNFSVKKVLLKLNLLLIVSVFLFMYIGYDWGRWINIGYSFYYLISSHLITKKFFTFYFFVTLLPGMLK